MSTDKTNQPAPEVASIITAPSASQADSLGEWHDYIGDFWDHNLRIVQEDNRYIMIGTPTRGNPFRLELTELPPEVGVARQFSAGSGDIYAIQVDGNLGLYDSDGLIRIAQKIE